MMALVGEAGPVGRADRVVKFARRALTFARSLAPQQARRTSMSEPRKDLLMQIDNMRSEGCAQAVRDALRRLDPDAEVSVDVEHQRVAIATRAEALEVAEALTAAGYEARGMTL
jgi:copper chaperone